MAKKSTNQAANVRGLNIYKDAYGRSIFYDRLTNVGYLITPKDANLYVLYSKRFIIPIFIFVLIFESTIAGFTMGFTESICVCLAAIMMMEILFRFHYLKGLTMIPNFKPTVKEDFMTRMTKDIPKGMLLFKSILYFILAVLLILLAYSENYAMELFTLCVIVSSVVVMIGIIYLISYFKK